MARAPRRRRSVNFQAFRLHPVVGRPVRTMAGCFASAAPAGERLPPTVRRGSGVPLGPDVATRRTRFGRRSGIRRTARTLEPVTLRLPVPAAPRPGRRLLADRSMPAAPPTFPITTQRGPGGSLARMAAAIAPLPEAVRGASTFDRASNSVVLPHPRDGAGTRIRSANRARRSGTARPGTPTAGGSSGRGGHEAPARQPMPMAPRSPPGWPQSPEGAPDRRPAPEPLRGHELQVPQRQCYRPGRQRSQSTGVVMERSRDRSRTGDRGLTVKLAVRRHGRPWQTAAARSPCADTSGNATESQPSLGCAGPRAIAEAGASATRSARRTSDPGDRAISQLGLPTRSSSGQSRPPRLGIRSTPARTRRAVAFGRGTHHMVARILRPATSRHEPLPCPAPPIR